MLAPFDGFHESEHAVSGTCLISFDRNRYSVMSVAARRTVQVRAYADRIVVRCGEEVVADHARFFGRNRTIYDPGHYLPVLVRQARRAQERRAVPELGPTTGVGQAEASPGLGRRGGPALRARPLPGADRWPEAVETAVAEALAEGAPSDDVVVNILARRREPDQAEEVATSPALALVHAPVADCAGSRPAARRPCELAMT